MTMNRDQIQELLDGVENLPSMPAVALQVVKLAQDDDATADDFAELLMLDSALSGKLLKLANSSLYNSGTPVRTLPRAVITLGLKSVKLMALSFSLVEAAPQEAKDGLDLRAYWRRTVTSAAAAHTFGSIACRRLVDEGFLCGLLSRLGQLVLATGMPDRYREVLEASGDSWPTAEIERDVFGCAGAEVAGELLRSWSLPNLLCDAVASHGRVFEELPEDPDARALAQLMEIAGLCEELVCGEDHKSSMAMLVDAAARHFDMDEDAVEDGLREVETRIAETADMLEVSMRPVRMDEILREAGQTLLKESLSIATEMEHVERIATQLESTNRELRDKVTRDALTGLANRRCFDQSLERCVAAHEEDPKTGIGLLMIDIDHFKAVNDELGHPVGDKVLKSVAQAIAGVIRERDLVARYGGEEFSVIFASTSKEGIEKAAERIRTAVESAQIEVGGRRVETTVSIGSAFAPAGTRVANAWDLVAVADECLYAAKRGGRNRSEFRTVTQD